MTYFVANSDIIGLCNKNIKAGTIIGNAGGTKSLYFGDTFICEIGSAVQKTYLTELVEKQNYQDNVKRTLPGNMMQDAKLAMLCMGLAGETGEVVDHVKKHLFQGHELSREKIVDESGNVLWYLAGIFNMVGTTFDEVMNRNIDKLNKRYPNGFDAQKSINREEKE